MNTTLPNYDGLINPAYLPLSRGTGETHALRQDEFIRVLPGFLLPSAVELFRAEARRLLAEHGARKDKMVNGSPRNLRTVNGTHLAEGVLIPGLLTSGDLHEFAGGIAGAELKTFGDRNEACVLMALEQKGDQHGRHSDEFRGVINIALDAPGDDDPGGVLTFDDPTAIDGAGMVQVRLRPGDAYYMDRTNRIAHEVTALTLAHSCRIIASVALCDPEGVHEPSTSSHLLFNGNETVA